MDRDIEDLKKDIRGVLTSAKHGIPQRKFLAEFEEATMERLSPQKYGFDRLHDLMMSIPDTVKVEHSIEGVIYIAVQNEATAGVAQLVSKQQSKKRPRVKTGVYGGKFAHRYGSSSKPNTSRLSSRSVAAPVLTKTPRAQSFGVVNQKSQGVPFGGKNTSRDYPIIDQRTGVTQRNYAMSQQNSYQQLPPVTNPDEISSLRKDGNERERHERSQRGGAYEPAVLSDSRKEPHYQPDPYEEFYDYIEEIEGEERVPSVELQPSFNRRMNDEHALEENQNNRRHRNDEPIPSSRADTPPLFFELPAQPVLDVDLSVTLLAFYVYMHTPSKFYVHLADEEKIQELANRCDQLAQSAMDIGNRRLVVGQLLLYKCEFDESWSRAQMLPNDHVLMVDFGSNEKYNPARAKYLPKELTAHPVMARQCSLAGVLPTSGAWSSGAIEEMTNRCQDVELYLKIHELRITSVEQKNPTLVVDVWIVEQVENPVQIRKTTRRTLGMASILVEAGFAHYNAVAASHPQIKKPSEKLVSKEEDQGDYIVNGEASKIANWFSNMVEGNELIGPSRGEAELEDLEDIDDQKGIEEDFLTRGRRRTPKINLDSASIIWDLLRPPLPQSYHSQHQRSNSPETKCVISHVDPLGTFFLKVLSSPAEAGRGRDWTGSDYLDQLLLEINTYKYLHDISNIISQPNVGQLYVAYDKRTQLFSRGVVSSVEPDHFLVLFVDQGYSCEVSQDMLRDPEPFQPAFSKLPQQVACYTLADIDYYPENHEDYINLLIDDQRVLTCTSAEIYDSNSVILTLPDGQLLSEVLYSLEVTEGDYQDTNRDLSPSPSYLIDKSAIFLNCQRPFRRLQPCDYLKHGQTATFTVVALNAGRHLKIVLLELYDIFDRLKRKLIEASKELRDIAPLSSLQIGSYFLVRSQKLTIDSQSPASDALGKHSILESDIHRCKLYDIISDLEFVFYDIDTGDTVFAKRNNIFSLPGKFLGYEFPLVTWDASFILSAEKKLPTEMVGRKLRAQVAYPTKDCLHLVNTFNENWEE
ncbi:uncharacterized protein LOC142342676 isoform X3 [Convolutriloba macropyga]|uniref:uncharacterized protein LOC142342676 isoform X3 n=1 Tax=Convolutriloba macropyga TaxID=536237 RepID=UPI003F51C91B